VGYSPLKSWRIKNFRNIGDITIDFTKSPIISLIGDNECGKTSVVKTFDVVGYNGNSKGQKDYIRDDTNGFGISGEFVDGSVVTRMKTNSTNLFQVTAPGQPMWQTNKLDSNEVPPQVQAIMGMIMESETKEPLHVRTYENQLLFVLTKASENYKVMYDALKVDNLTRAIKDGSSEANELRADIKSKEISIDTLTENLKGIQILDIEPAIKIKERLKAELDQLEKMEAALRLVDRNKELNRQLGSLAEIRGLDEVNMSEVAKLLQYNSIKNSLDKLNESAKRYKDLETIENIDISPEQKISTVMVYIHRNSDLEKVRDRYEGVKGLEEINITQLANINTCKALVEKTRELVKHNERYTGHGLDTIDENDILRIHNMQKVLELLNVNKRNSDENEELHVKVHELQQQIRDCGAIVGVCPNCQTDVIMEV